MKYAKIQSFYDPYFPVYGKYTIFPYTILSITGKDVSYYTQCNLISNIQPIVPKTKFHISTTKTKVIFRRGLSKGSSKHEPLFQCRFCIVIKYWCMLLDLKNSIRTWRKEIVFEERLEIPICWKMLRKSRGLKNVWNVTNMRTVIRNLEVLKSVRIS